MPRTLSAQMLEDAYAPRTETVYLVFATIDHPDIAIPIRVVNDVKDYIYRGETFIGIPFQFEILSDTDQQPRGIVTIQNTTRHLGEVIQAISTPPRLKLEIVSSDDFDLTVNPRVESASPVTAEYTADHLVMKNISVNAVAIEAQISSFDPSAEPWPETRATKNRLPGLFK